METIRNYLDNMFMNFPNTEKTQRAKQELWEMMEDKYNELIAGGKKEHEAIGIVISEFGNLQELEEELGVTDENDKIFDKIRFVKNEEAEEYLFQTKWGSRSIAAGVMLCIYSPIILLLLGGIQEYLTSVSDGIVEGVGITVLLLMIACAVGLFIYSSMKLDNYEYLKKECFRLNYEFENIITETYRERKKIITFKVIIGVILCILSVLPLLISEAIIYEITEFEFIYVISIVFILFIIGIAVALFITAGMEEDSYKIILQENAYAIEKKQQKISDTEKILGGIYWPIITFIYLVWSFKTERWEITWIIWPLSAILYGTVCKIIEVVKKN